MLDGGGGGGQSAVELGGENSDGACAIIGNEHIATGSIDDEVARAGSFGGLLIELRELAGLGVDRKSGYGTGGLVVEGPDLIGRVKESLTRVNRKKGRTWSFGHELCLAEGTGLEVESVEVNPLALRPGVGAHEDVCFLWGSGVGFRRDSGRDGQQES